MAVIIHELEVLVDPTPGTAESSPSAAPGRAAPTQLELRDLLRWAEEREDRLRAD